MFATAVILKVFSNQCTLASTRTLITIVTISCLTDLPVANSASLQFNLIRNYASAAQICGDLFKCFEG